MGIPMWREPSEANNVKTTLDKDSSAAARSAIRRQPTIRRASRHSRSRAGVLSTLQSQLIDEIHRDYGIDHRQSTVRSPVLNLGVSEDGLDLDTTRREALNRSSARSSPPRRDHSGRWSSSATDHALNLILSGPEPRSPEISDIHTRPNSLTPSFAPALYQSNVSSSPSTAGIRLPPLVRSDTRSHDPISHIPSALLRDYRTRDGPTRPRESAIDGLGDRQRSLSPETNHDDAWETLLTTITPDASLPSTDTSFSSNSASAPDSSRNRTSRNPTTSSRTAPSFSSRSARSRPFHHSLDPYPDHLNPCDFSSDDEDTPVNYHQVLTPSGLQMPLRRSPGLHSTMSGHPPGPTFTFLLSPNESSDADRHALQLILDRVASREDFPDEMRRAAGLSSRNMGRGLDAGAEPNENDRAR